VSEFDTDFRCSNFEDKIKKHESLDTSTPTWKSKDNKDPHSSNLDERMKNVSGVMSNLKSIKKY
jgi:hypothetical protein